MPQIQTPDYAKFIRDAHVSFDELTTNAAPHRFSSFPWTFQDTDNHDAARFRERFSLDKIVATARDEWHAIRLLRNWVSLQVAVGGPRGHRGAPGADAETALLVCAAGGSFNCTYYTAIAKAVYLSMGWICRNITINTDFARWETGGHSVFDIWVNSLRKWVLLDARYDTHYELDGIPLSALELHRAAARGKGRDIEIRVSPENRRGACNDMRCPPGMTPADRFYWIRYHLTHAPFSSDGVERSRRKALFWIDEANENNLIHPNNPQKQADFQEKIIPVRDPSEIDFDCNVVSLEPHAGPWRPGAVVFEVNTFTPNFAGLEVRFKDGAWQPFFNRNRLQWNVYEGDNLLEVRTINKMGQAGPVTSLALKNAKADYNVAQWSSYSDDSIFGGKPRDH